MMREVREEILDGLSPGDPEAVRSRADLRRINFLMGNSRWIVRQVGKHRESAEKGIVELGAGEGILLRELSEFGPVVGLDLMPRPHGLPPEVGWESGDATRAEVSGGILVANLFLHHFEGPELRSLGKLVRNFDLLVAVEPWRTAGALWLGRTMNPLVGRVTRHDMEVSIRAGFRPGELAAGLGLEDRRFSERTSWRGGLRVLAW